jgi:hypothetical protein
LAILAHPFDNLPTIAKMHPFVLDSLHLGVIMDILQNGTIGMVDHIDFFGPKIG